MMEAALMGRYLYRYMMMHRRDPAAPAALCYAPC